LFDSSEFCTSNRFDDDDGDDGDVEFGMIQTGSTKKFDGAHVRVERRCGVDVWLVGEILVWIRNGVLTDVLARIQSRGLDWCDDEAETVVVGDGDACSIDDDDVLLSFVDDESFFSDGSLRK